MACRALIRILIPIGHQMVVARFHRIIEYTCACRYLAGLAGLLALSHLIRLAGPSRRERMRLPLSTTIHSTIPPLTNSMAWASAETMLT